MTTRARPDVDIVAFGDLDEYLDTEGPAAGVIFQICSRGRLTRRDLRMSTKMWHRITERHRGLIVLTVFGYDDDPRELWQVPEVADFVRRWAKRVGLTSYESALATLRVPDSVTLLAACGVFGPVEVEVAPRVRSGASP